MSSSQRYHYARLDQNKREIRLLEIHPAKDPASQGDTSNPVTIELNGVALSITLNLHSALRQLSHDGSMRLLWVDAVCINQQDISERNHQITLMRDIYEGAEQTIVWLGEAADDSDLAFWLIKAWSICHRDFDHFAQRFPFAFDQDMWDAATKLLQRPWWGRVWVYQEFVLSKKVLFACGKDSMSNDVLKLAWQAWDDFSASDAGKRLNAEKLSRVVVFGTGQIDRLQYQHLMHNLRRECIQRGEPLDGIARMDLLELLRMTRDMKATDPRDKLYALLGVDDIRDILVQPNYHHSELKVYTDFAVNFIKMRSNLEILVDAGIGIPKRDLRLPSWVPDWRWNGFQNIGGALTSSDHRASGDHGSSPRLDASGSLLSVSGFICDVLIAREPPETLEQRTQQWGKLALNSNCAHPTGMPRVQVFFRTMIADLSGYGFGRPDFKDDTEWKDFVDLAKGFMIFSGSRPPENLERTSSGVELTEKSQRWLAHNFNNSIHASFLHIFLKLVPDKPFIKTDRELLQPFLKSTGPHGDLPWPYDDNKPTDEDKQSLVRYMEHAQRHTMRKSFFVTEKGYMGFGAANLHEGDLVCIIFGCPHPLLLRETGDTYHLVGEVYIYGMMRGEMMAEFEAGKFAEETFVLQ